MKTGYFYLDLEAKKIFVRFPSGSFSPAHRKMKWFLDRFAPYNPVLNRSELILDFNKEVAKDLIDLGFDTEPYTFNFAYGPEDRSYRKIELDKKVDYLRRFQKDGLKYILAHNCKALLAFDPGLGKTPSSLALILQKPDIKKTLVVCPATVKEQWAAEYNKFIGIGTPEVLYGRNSVGHIYDAPIVIMNYDILASGVEKKKHGKGTRYNIGDTLKTFKKNNFDYIIIDECHYIKNKTKSYKAVYYLANDVDNCVALSGTPVENRSKEIWNIANLLAPRTFNNEWFFLNRYCGPVNNGFGIEYKGSTLSNELNRKMRDTFMFRRKKESVIAELPKVQKIVVPIKLDKYKEYAKYNRELMDNIEDKSNKLMYANAFEKLLQKSYELKEHDVHKFIKDILEATDKLVVFCWHKKSINAIMEKFGDIAVKIDGSTPAEKRTAIKDEFVNNPKIKLFVGNIISAGTGLDGLQKVCDTAIFAELTWKSTKIDQAIDRINRMGFTGVSITVYFLIAMKTVEERISGLLDRKRKVVDRLVDSTDTDDQDLLETLIEQSKDGEA
jgi:SWI/SNF-related matrix-associated actin-dependent regulator 1 of chromatin subfamily A